MSKHASILRADLNYDKKITSKCEESNIRRQFHYEIYYYYFHGVDVRKKTDENLQEKQFTATLLVGKFEERKELQICEWIFILYK